MGNRQSRRWVASALTAGLVFGLAGCGAASATGPAAPAFLDAAQATKIVGAVYPLNPPPGPATDSPTGWAPATYIDSGPPLLFVDHEAIPGPGLLARTQVNGSIRLFSYLVSVDPTPLSFAWVLENQGTRSVKVTVTNHAAAAPGEDYLPLAASVQKAFLQGTKAESFRIAPGAIHVLQDASTVPSPANALATSIYDLETTGTLEVESLGTTDLGSLTAHNLPMTYAGGGGKSALYPHDQRQLTVTFTGARAVADIAGNQTDDPGMLAPDLNTGVSDRDLANFGVTYQVHIVFPAGPSRTSDLWVTARGCSLRADLKMESGPLADHVVQLPAVGTLPVGPLGTALAPLGIPAGVQSVFSFTFLPPSGACTPFVVREDPVNPDAPQVQLYQTAVWRS